MDDGLTAYSDIVELVTLRYFADEIDVVRIERAAIFKEVKSGTTAVAGKESGEFRFGLGAILEGLATASMLLGTAKTVVDLFGAWKKSRQPVTLNDLSSAWRARLIEEGIDETRAGEIVTEFARPLHDRLTREV